MSTLDVLYVFRDARPSTGGLAIDIRNLAQNLTESGRRVGVVTVEPTQSAAGDFDELGPEIEVTKLRPRPFKQFANSFGLAPGAGRLVGEQSAAIVHVFSCLPVWAHFAAMAAARRDGRTLVWTPMLHPGRQLIWPDYGARGRAMRVFDSAAPRIARFVDAVAAATDDEARHFLRLGCKRVEVIPPSVHDESPVPTAEARAFRARLMLDSGPLILMVTGRDERRKGLAFGLEAFALLRRRIPRATLLLVGLPETTTDLPAGVRLAGRLSEADIGRAYRAADLAFVPSSYEAFSRVVIEAWQQERPVVVADRVGLAGTVDGHDAGKVVGYGDSAAAADALAALLTNDVLAHEAGKRGRALVERRYLVSATGEQMRALYDDLREDRRMRSPK